MQLLTLKNLKNYNLFSCKDNNIILNALLYSDSEIKIKLKKQFSEDSAIKLFNHLNKEVCIDKTDISQDKLSITLEGNFKFSYNYSITINNESANVILNSAIGGILDRYFFSDDDFGITFTGKNKIKFKLWSPPAVSVELLFFDKNQQPVVLRKRIFLKNTGNGIWETESDKPDNAVFYQYKIKAYGKEYTALDPYAKSMAVFDAGSEDKTGKAAIINLKSGKANPPYFKKKYRNFDFTENETDIISYEVNIRDFTIQPGVVDGNIAGTFKGFIEKIPYLKKLGITHVQLMPVNKTFTQKEINRKYTGKTATESNYNWGYDPMNFFTPEGRYSTNPYDPHTRIYELKEMIQALHDADIGVILDVVFNHTYIADTFEKIAPGCYYRLNDDYTISGYTGAGASIESRRKQVRKFIIDVLKFWVEEYYIDGFRFDLMSFFDKETMKQIRNEVGRTYNPDNPNELILQGEAWDFTDLKDNAFVKTDYDSLNIGIFNDTFRDAVAGNGKNHGFIHGNQHETSRLVSAITGAVKSYDSDCMPYNKDVFFNPYNLFAKEPVDCLNFMSIHDGLTLWDKINLTVKDTSKKERLRLMKFAYAILFTSQGKIILHGGDEILRTKPLADFDKERHRALTSDFVDKEEDSIFFHKNSYCSPDYTNMFRWDRLTNEYSEFANELLTYVKGLIKMRRYFSVFRFNTAEEINKNIDFIDENCEKKLNIHSFKSYKLQKLILKFINGKAGETLCLTGEIHKKEANPEDNPYILKFNEYGEAEIEFTKNNIHDFDLQKWDYTRNLNFKLVKTPGKWDFNPKYYSDFGHNSVSPESINEKFEVIIDLSRKDFKNIKSDKFSDKNYIAYKIKNLNKEFIIIHNAQNEDLNLQIKEIENPKDWSVILDNKTAGTKLVKNSEILIKKNEIIIPEKSSSVILKINGF